MNIKLKKMFWYELARYIFTYSYPISCFSALSFIVYLLILVPLSLETLDQPFCVLKKKKVNHFLISAVHAVFTFVIIWFRNLNLNFCSHFYVYTWKTVAYLPMVITMVYIVYKHLKLGQYPTYNRYATHFLDLTHCHFR